jgi:hypothetical protein
MMQRIKFKQFLTMSIPGLFRSDAETRVRLGKAIKMVVQIERYEKEVFVARIDAGISYGGCRNQG